MIGSAQPSGLRCRQCTKPFGFVVAFCPYCGTAQQAAAKSSPPTVAPAAPRPVPLAAASSASSVSPFKPALWLPAKTSVPTVQPVPKQAAAVPKQKPVQKPKTPVPPRHARRRPGVLTLLAIGLIAAWLMRPGPPGTLVVYTTPSVPGRVTVDGERAGLPGQRLEVPAGMHRLGYQADGWTTAGRLVRVAAQEQRGVTIVLSPVPAQLVIDLQTPGAALRLDDQPVDASPDGVRVPAGRHRLTATRPGFAALSLDLVLARGERRFLPVMLSPVAVREVTRAAVPGSWSEPVLLPPHTDFALAASGRFRLRVGQDVLLVQPGSTVNLGDVRGQSLQVKAVQDEPVDVHIYLKPEG